MSKGTEQTVTEETATAGATQPAVADVGAPEPDLDALLAEFDQEVAAATSEVTAPATPAATGENDDNGSGEDRNARVDELLQEQEARRHEQLAAEVETGIQSAIESMGEAFVEEGFRLTPSMLRGLLFSAGSKDERFTLAFTNRDSKPEIWKQVLGAIVSQEVKSLRELPDAETTRGRDTLTSAVQAAGGKGRGGASDVNWGSLSNAEFAAKKAELGEASRKRAS